MSTKAMQTKEITMAQVTVPHSQVAHRTGLVVFAVAALLAVAGLFAWQAGFASSSGAAPSGVTDSGIVERGPNHDIAPMWGSGNSS